MERVMRSPAWAWALMVLIVCSVQTARGQEGTPPLKKPKAFPAVPGVGTNMHYSTFSLDTWTGQVAYLMVEGNSSGGFTRVFAWIPGDSRYGKPMEWKAKAMDGNPNAWTFGELENKAAEGDEKIRITWRFFSVKEARGAGSDTTTDYTTGKTVSRSWGASTWHRMRYSLALGYAYGKGPAASMDGTYPLELGDGDDMRLYPSWAQVPEPHGGGFSAAIRARHEVQESRDPKKARVLCLFEGFEGVTIKKTPPELTVGLTVSPYMGEMIYSNTLSMAEFMKSGFDLDVPYGWYSIRLRGFRYGRFSFGGSIPRITIDPFPISRPAAGGK
jgi:hypothetical protein